MRQKPKNQAGKTWDEMCVEERIAFILSQDVQCPEHWIPSLDRLFDQFVERIEREGGEDLE